MFWLCKTDLNVRDVYKKGKYGSVQHEMFVPEECEVDLNGLEIIKKYS